MAERYAFYDRQNDVTRFGTIKPITTVVTGYEPDYIFTSNDGEMSRPVYSSDISPITLDVDLLQECINTTNEPRIAEILSSLLNAHYRAYLD